MTRSLASRPAASNTSRLRSPSRSCACDTECDAIFSAFDSAPLAVRIAWCAVLRAKYMTAIQQNYQDGGRDKLATA
jgi:hypothetical protein